MIAKLRFIYRRTVAIVFLFVVWDAAARFGVVDTFILPKIDAVAGAFWEMLRDGELFWNIAVSLRRTGSGFAAAIAFGIPLGLLLGWFPKAEEYLDPLLQMFRNTSVMAMFPVFILVFGLGELSKSAVVFWGSLWPSLLNTIGGVKGVDPILIKSARSMGMSTSELFGKVILPAALPEIMTGIRLSAGVAVILLVAAEMLGATGGLGFQIFNSQQKYDIPAMYAGILTISFLGILINFLLVRLERRVAYWKRQR
ncbi:MAG: ABC transporter permease [Synergistaceae bacterium]|jgi:NitT/TauT family transport system permease protein|nr:ABC transporter permease [Synergistaceae bacterium]